MLKLAKIATSVKLLEGVGESVWKYHHWIFHLEYMLLETYQVQKFDKEAQSVCELH